MKVFLPNPARPSRTPQSERGIALIITLILLSVVTFLAVAFLFLATREQGAVKNTKDQSVSRSAAEAAQENARVQIIASLISSNQFNYRMIVSTNYFNTNGFVDGSPSLTNVNYDYLSPLSGGGTNFNIDQRNQNIANLYYASRPPVFVRTNRNGKGDFRFYLDLNQNGRFDTNGLMVEIGERGRPLFTVDASGNRIPLTNFFVGDPEWVGVLERPDRPHSASNKFVARWCFIVVPSGKTLDINTIHNQAKFPSPASADGFIRNMGVGPWEMNLAAFLVDLNTNVWNRNLSGSLPTAFVNPTPYAYNTALATPSVGTAFDDAVALTRYRYGGNWNNLKSVTGLFGGVGGRAVELDGADDYGAGPLLLTNTTPTVDGDFTFSRTGKPWPGAENPNHFFTTQDLLDSTKTRGTLPTSFSDRLFYAGYYGNSFYDRYTFYRFLSQMGMDTPPDPTLTNKINLNYVNVDATGHVVPDLQTNFVSWSDPLQFFTNAADRLLRATFTDPKANLTNFGVASVIGLTNIPVLISNRLVYSPSLNRVLQVTANIWDSTTNRITKGGFNYPYLPSVFRPIFQARTNTFKPAITDIYIVGYQEVGALSGGTADPRLAAPMNLGDPDPSSPNGLVQALALARTSDTNLNIYGVPWVIGAKKGFPNFNEFAMQSVVQVSRKLQIRKPDVNLPPNATNQLYIVGISNTFAFEAWNSYQSPYTREAQVVVLNDISIGLTYTNDVQDLRTGPPRGGHLIVTTNPPLVIPANTWLGYGSRISQPAKKSFIIPLRTNLVVIKDEYYRSEPPTFVGSNSNSTPDNTLYLGFEQTGKFPIPQFNLAISNHIRFIMLDTKTQRIVDYVQLDDMNSSRNLTSEITDFAGTFVDGSGITPSESQFWRTNRPAGNGSLFNPPEGVINQIQAALGNIKVSDWKSIGLGAPPSQQKEIDGFNAFMLSASSNTNKEMQVPFTPSRKTSQVITWQANDPLVHYMAGDLRDLSVPKAQRENPNDIVQPMKNIGALNHRFEPWGGRIASSVIDDSSTPAGGIGQFELKGKDPGVRVSDNWDFPTNKFGTVGLLGRVHRGTPWQTVYLKAEDIEMRQWTNWTGNANFLDATMSRPVMDRALFDVFTTAFNQDSTRGQLNVNQTGLAAWSAWLGGVIGLTNTSSEDDLLNNPPLVTMGAFIIDPAGTDPSGPTNSILGKIHDAVDRMRTNAPFNGSFKHLGDILAVPELTTASPLLNTNGSDTFPTLRLENGFNDAMYERLPQQLLGLMRGGEQPSFTIYSFGQALHPANRSIVTSGGPYSGLCTNYQITAEFATRTVVRVEGAPANPRAVVESFNVLPADEPR